MNISEAFDAAVAGTLTQGELLETLAKTFKISKEVRRVFIAMDKRDEEEARDMLTPRRELTTEEVSAAYAAGTASMYADHDKGYTLD